VVTGLPVGLAAAAFGAATAVSLSTSYLFVTRLERIAGRLGISEALLGMVAALAADTPEITSAVTALASGQHQVGTGVVTGSNVFNLAALLGLGAVMAGGIAVGRRVVLLGGVTAGWVALACLATVAGLMPAAAGLAAVLAVLLPYTLVLALGSARLARLPVAWRWEAWLAVAISEEERELGEVIQRARGGRAGLAADLATAAVTLAVVVAASIAMERSASALGSAAGLPAIVTGGVVLAAVTSLPNAVSAVYLARRGRGAAMLSTTLNSNALNVTAGLLVPGTVTGLGAPSAQASLIAAWYAGLTLAAVAIAYRRQGVRPGAGLAIIAGYLAFLGWLLLAAGLPGELGRHGGAELPAVLEVFGAGLADHAHRRAQPAPGEPPGDRLHRPYRARGVAVAVHVQGVRAAGGGGQARVVDRVEEVLERPGHVADVGRGAQQVAVGGEHIGGPGRERGPGHHVHALDLVGGGTGHHLLEHGLHGRRGGVVDDQQRGHRRISCDPVSPYCTMPDKPSGSRVSPATRACGRSPPPAQNPPAQNPPAQNRAAQSCPELVRQALPPGHGRSRLNVQSRLR
jgi:cation:H+ antiporter